MLRADSTAGSRARLDADERVHAPQSLRRLPPNDVAADERLQLHQRPERLQCPPRLHNVDTQAAAERLVSTVLNNGPVEAGVDMGTCS
jgi:hypothetical protein